MTDEERLERLVKIKSEQESFTELYERENREQQNLIARDFMHQHSDYLIERVQELESLYRIEKERSLDLLVRNKRMHKALNHIQSEVMKVAPNDLLFEIYDTTREGLGEV